MLGLSAARCARQHQHTRCPGTFTPDIFNKVRFAAQPNPFQQPGRCDVFGIAGRADPLEV
jgi:hypothetical protein